MNTPVSFEIAKMLKEKGVEQKERPSYLLVPFRECTTLDIAGHDCNELGIGDRIGYYIPNKTINAPTIAEIVMWLFVNHDIWMWVERGKNPAHFYPVINSTSYRYSPDRWRDSIKEAYEIGIKDALKNLIK